MNRSHRIALALASILVAGSFVLAQPNLPGLKDVADLVQKGDMDAARKAAGAYAAKHPDVENLMDAYKPPAKGGIGVAGGGIGLAVAKGAPAAAKMADLEKMGNDIAAISLITKLIPTKDAKANAANLKEWNDYADNAKAEGLKLAAAAKANNAAGVTAAAAKVNANCNSCHTKFR